MQRLALLTRKAAAELQWAHPLGVEIVVNLAAGGCQQCGINGVSVGSSTRRASGRQRQLVVFVLITVIIGVLPLAFPLVEPFSIKLLVEGGNECRVWRSLAPLVSIACIAAWRWATAFMMLSSRADSTLC